MLPRLILIVLLAIVGIHAVVATVKQQHAQQQQEQQRSSVDALRRFVNRVRSGASAFVPNCQGASCVNQSVGMESRSLFGINLNPVKSVNGDAADDNDGDEDDGDDTAVEEGRGKKKKKKGYGKMMIVLAAFTKAAMLYLMIHAVAALAGKALVVAKVALAIALAVALKKSQEHKTAYEIVKHPQYSHVNTHSSSVDYDHSGGGGYEGGSRRRRGAY